MSYTKTRTRRSEPSCCDSCNCGGCPDCPAIAVSRGGLMRLGGVQSSPRIMRGTRAAKRYLRNVPLSRRSLDGLESQGFARTLSDVDCDKDTTDPVCIAARAPTITAGGPNMVERFISWLTPDAAPVKPATPAVVPPGSRITVTTPPAKPAGMSTGAKVAIGAGALAVAFLALRKR